MVCMMKSCASSFVGGIIGGIFAMGGYCLWKHVFGKSRNVKNISRLRTQDPRSSAVTIYDGLIFLSGQVGEIQELEMTDCETQTRQTLKKIETLLLESGSNKSRILEARIWLKDIGRDFESMNKVWNEWIDSNDKGVRVCVESPMARPSILVEIQVLAAVAM